VSESTVAAAAPPAGSSDRVPGLLAVAAALLLGGALAVAGPHPAAVLAVIAVVQVIGVLCAVLFLDLPGRVGALVLGCAAAVAADVSLWRWSAEALAPLLPVLALAVPLMFAHQLTRGAARVRLTASLSAIAALGLSVVALGCWLQLAHEATGGGLVRGAATAIGARIHAGRAADLLGRTPRVDAEATPTIGGVVAGTLVGAVAGSLVLHRSAGLPWLSAAAVALALALIGALLHLGASFAFADGGPVRFDRPLVRMAAAFAVASPAAYVLCLAAA